MFKVGLIGLGAVGYLYRNGRGAKNLTHFDAINSNPDLELVCGIDPHQPSNWPSKVSYLADINEMNMPCDIFVIASPTQTHVEIVKSICALANRPKLILLEKPAGKLLSDTIKINQMSNNYNIPIYVNFFRDCMVKNILKFLLREKITYIRIDFTGSLINCGYHFLHFVKKIMQEDIKVLRKIKYNDNVVYFCKIRHVDLVVFGNNNRIPENYINFYFKKGKITYDNENNSINFYDLKKNKIYAEEDNYVIEKSISASLEQGFSLVYSELVQALRGDICNVPGIKEVKRFREEFESEFE